MKKVLLIQTSFIGDVVLATTILETLHQADPSIQLAILVRKGNESLFTGHPYLSEVLVWDKKRNKYLNLLRLAKKIRSTKYDTVINLQRFAATGFLAVSSGASRIMGYDKNPFSFLFNRKVKHQIGTGPDYKHEIERCHELIQPFTDKDPQKPCLYPTKSDYEHIVPYQEQPYLVVAPGSMWFTKEFPLHKWKKILEDVPDDFPIFLIGGESDQKKAGFICQQLPEKNIVNLTGQLSYLQSVALMEAAVLNLVNDSAPLHFASSRNAPVLAIFCSTVPHFGFGPLSNEQYIIEVKKSLSCRPCGLHGKKTCPTGNFACGETIPEAEIKRIIFNKLQAWQLDQVLL